MDVIERWAGLWPRLHPDMRTAAMGRASPAYRLLELRRGQASARRTTVAGLRQTPLPGRGGNVAAVAPLVAMGRILSGLR